MPSYMTAREGVTPVAGDVLLALTTGLEELSRITEVSVEGEATATAVNRMAVRRSTTNGVTPTAQTPSKGTPMSQAAYTSGATTFGTQPTTAAAPALWSYALNVHGGIVRWVASPYQELYLIGATAGNNEASLESSAGTGVVTCQIVHEEL